MVLKKIFRNYLFLLLGILLFLMIGGCFGGEKTKIESEYSFILDKILKDSENYKI